MLRYIVAMVDATGHAQLNEIHSAYSTLAEIHRLNPDVVEAVVRHPSVGCWAVRTSRHLSRGEISSAAPEHISLVAAAAAIRARIPYQARTTVRRGQVVIPSLGRALFSNEVNGAEASVQVTGRGSSVVAAGRPVLIPDNSLNPRNSWQPLMKLRALAYGSEIGLLVDDFDPYRFEGLSTLAAPLTYADLKSWDSQLQDAWRLLVRNHRRVADEVRTVILVLTPLNAPDSMSALSATSRDAFGAVALSLPRSGIVFALTLAHEIQHAKLAALLDLVELVRPDANTLYYAPWRDDPRPAYALLHGAYAHLGVADFWRRQRCRSTATLTAHSEYARWRDAVRETVEVLLASSDLTPAGQRFVCGMLTTVQSWHRDQVPPAARDLALAAARNHRIQWCHRNELRSDQSHNPGARPEGLP